jgi:hypothetical protein
MGGGDGANRRRYTKVKEKSRGVKETGGENRIHIKTRTFHTSEVI